MTDSHVTAIPISAYCCQPIRRYINIYICIYIYTLDVCVHNNRMLGFLAGVMEPYPRFSIKLQGTSYELDTQ